MSTESISSKLRKLIEVNQLPLRKFAIILDIDVAILSKMERGEKRLTKEMVHKLSKLYHHDTEDFCEMTSLSTEVSTIAAD